MLEELLCQKSWCCSALLGQYGAVQNPFQCIRLQTKGRSSAGLVWVGGKMASIPSKMAKDLNTLKGERVYCYCQVLVWVLSLYATLDCRGELYPSCVPSSTPLLRAIAGCSWYFLLACIVNSEIRLLRDQCPAYLAS